MQDLISDDPVLQLIGDDNKKALLRFNEYSLRFTPWLKDNLVKIRGKLRGLRTAEDITDVKSELTCAATLLNSPWVKNLVYEPLGTLQRAPDFKVVLNNGQEIYVEVRRIRRSVTEMSRDEFLNNFRTKIKLLSLNYGISIYCNELESDVLNENQIYRKLALELDKIIAEIETELVKFEQDRANFKGATINLDHYLEGLKIEVDKVPESKIDNRVHYYGTLHNCPTTGREYTKFADVIFDKLGQLVYGAINVIYIVVDNDSHEFEDLEDSISSINQLLSEHSESFFRSKGYNDQNHFLTESQKLGGVIIHDRSNQVKVWTNCDAIPKLPESLIKILSDLCLGPKR